MRQPCLVDDPNAPAILGKPNCPVGSLIYLHRPFHRQEWEISLYRAVIRLGRGSDGSHHKGLIRYWIMFPLADCVTTAASLRGIGGTAFSRRYWRISHSGKLDHRKFGSVARLTLGWSSSQAHSVSLNSDNSAVSPAIGTVKIAATPKTRKSLTIQPADRSNGCLALSRNKPNSSWEVRVHSILGCEKFD